MNKSKKFKDIETIVKNKKIKAFGIDIELTEEHLKKFEKLLSLKYKNPYERADKGEKYCVIVSNYFGKFFPIITVEEGNDADTIRFETGNYYNNEEFTEQVVMELKLQEKLRRFTYENGWSEDRWKDEYAKWYIYIDTFDGKFSTEYTFYFKEKKVYFDTEEIAQRAINEIIIPFMKENPNFKW